MDWEQLTAKIEKEFHFSCFFLNRESWLWRGKTPPATFRHYLNQLFKTKKDGYFKEIRFFKFAAGKDKPSRYLALVPVRLPDFPFNFVGLIYESGDRLQELLKFRILPMYLGFWLQQDLTASRISQSEDGGPTILLQALEERKHYARHLEAKVGRLSREIENVRQSSQGLDEKVIKLNQMLDGLHEEYSQLADAYQDLFRDSQTLQTEYLSNYALLEDKIVDLEQRCLHLQAQQKTWGDISQHSSYIALKNGLLEAEDDRKNLKAELAEAKAVNRKLKNRLKAFEQTAGGITPLKVRQLVETLDVVRKQGEKYRQRCLQLELHLKAQQGGT